MLFCLAQPAGLYRVRLALLSLGSRENTIWPPLFPSSLKSESAYFELLGRFQSAMPTKPSRSQWEQLDDQMSRTPSENDPEGVPGEHTLAPSATAQRPRSVAEWEGRCAPDRPTQQVRIQSNLQTRGAEACRAVVESWMGRIVLCNGVRKESVMQSNEE